MSRVAQKKLEESVALAGPYLEQRLRALKIGVDVFRRAPDLPAVIRGPLAAARRALKDLPQMGDGGAYRMLLFAAGHPVLPVDARVSRVAAASATAGHKPVLRKTRGPSARPRPSSCPGRLTPTAGHSPTSITTAPRRAPTPIRTATSARCYRTAGRDGEGPRKPAHWHASIVVIVRVVVENRPRDSIIALHCAVAPAPPGARCQNGVTH